jgi:hypothetical protein
MSDIETAVKAYREANRAYREAEAECKVADETLMGKRAARAKAGEAQRAAWGELERLAAGEAGSVWPMCWDK